MLDKRDSFSGAGTSPQVPVETAAHFYATNSLMLADPLHIAWDRSIYLVFRDNLGVEHPEDSIAIAGDSNAVFRLLRDLFGYEPPFKDTEELEIRAGYALGQNGETQYGPLGPGPVNVTEFQTDYLAAFQSKDATHQDRLDFVMKWFAEKEQAQKPMTLAAATAVLAAAGYTATPPPVPEIQLLGPVSKLGPDFGNALKAWVSIRGGTPMSISVRPDNPPTAWDDAGNPVTGIDVPAILALMQKA